MVIAILFFSLVVSFSGIQLYLWWLWRKGKPVEKEVRVTKRPSVTVLIPVHNEELYIEDCLRAMLAQTYPKELLEIIVVNDHSSDRTSQIIDMFPEVRHIDQFNDLRGKKSALQTGIEAAAGEIVLTTDGDCEVGMDWVGLMVQCIMHKETNILATGPVWVVPGKPVFLERYQEMEQAALNVITYSGLYSGMVLSSMGANQAYSKSVYLELDPYADNHSIPSGDDVFFAQKLHQNGGEVYFVKDRDAMVYTQPVSTFLDFVRQRLRWSGKVPEYVHWPTTLYMAGFTAQIMSFLVLFILGFWEPMYFTYLFYGLVLKFFSDSLIISAGMQWGKRSICWQDILKASLFQVLYVLYVSFLFLIKRNIRWKIDKG